ncbi:TetR family transcriptional regulator [Rhodobium gokarnense]|uniref:AcrR family transcriptional regulator n=1 Tax=Rhodobium gokarnense TaxID=364296 RepID=A0ABT3HIK0_9HYPH|nr:TetR family transcriptional regulator [Rhodobium gokarnense]MCW2310241.1 AcrR family transcriptional regulator [Rhodobium gokarnense]
MQGDQAREYILDAAAHLVQESGAEALTLPAIAAAADLDLEAVEAVYPTMDDLFSALLQRMFDTFVCQVEATMGRDEAPGAWARAYVAASFPPDDDNKFSDIAAALLSSTLYKPELIQPLRERQPDLQSAMFSDGIDPLNAAIVRLAVDGLWVNRMFRIDAVPKDMERQVLDRLTAMAAAPSSR